MKKVVFKTFMMAIVAFVCINLASCSPKTPKELKEAAEKLKDSTEDKELSSGQIDDALDLLEEIVEQRIKMNEDFKDANKELAKNLEEGKEQFEKSLEAANVDNEKIEESIQEGKEQFEKGLEAANENIQNIVNGEDLEYLRKAYDRAKKAIKRSKANISEAQEKRFDELKHKWKEEDKRGLGVFFKD